MKNLLFLLFVTSVALFANTQQSQLCKSCHPVIYDEYYDSVHRKASVYNDPIHKSVWDNYTSEGQEEYKCAKCHSPADEEVLRTKLLQDNAVQRNEPISCVYCHSIQDVQKHAKANKNILVKTDKLFFSADTEKKGNKDVKFEKSSNMYGLNKETSGSPYHKIDYSNENYYSGNICMGCHSHKQNANDFNVCSMDVKEDKNDKNTCVSCHMPQVLGSKVNINKSKTHAYHGIAGLRHMTKSMGEYIGMDVKKSGSGFEVTLTNKANHTLFAHPLRVAKLNVSIHRAGKTIELEPYTIVRVIGKDGKPSMPWAADETIKDTLVKAYEEKKIAFETPLNDGDKVNVSLGYYLVNPKALKKLNLEDNEEATKFTLLKKQSFIF